MKILYIITQADGGGAQKYVLTLARHFGGAIAAGSEDSKMFEAAEASLLRTYKLEHLRREISPWHDFLAVWEIRQLIKAYQPDIVHLNSTKAGVLGSFAAIGIKTKIVFTAHGFIFNEPLSFWVRSFYLAMEKTASGYRDYIITVSDADKQSALDNNLIAGDKISTIHNGLEPIKFLLPNEARRALSLAGNKITVGCVANFYKTKGVDVLIEAISMLSDEIKTKVFVVLIGDGPEIFNLKSLILNLKLSGTIKLLGKIENASRYFKAFDLLVIPSRKEGFPYAILEAMQAGLPIVATSVGGIPEAIGDAGILVEPENPKKLAFAITTLLMDNSISVSLSKKAAHQAGLFTEEKMLAETKKIYTLILNRK